jgi:iron complex transport system permease protein
MVIPSPAVERPNARLLRRRRAAIWTAILASALIGGVILASTLGAARIPPHVSAGVLLQSAGISTPSLADATETQQQIIRAIRLPRILVAAMVGAALALVGASMQALFRNPMADPGIVGVSAGGALGAVLVIGSGLAASHWIVLPGAAFGGSLAASLVVFLFSLRRGRSDLSALLLAGIAVTYLCSAATSALISFTYDRDTLREMLFWLLGVFDNRGWEHVSLVVAPVVFGAAVIVGNARTLNLLALGEEEAQSLGLSVQRSRAILLVAGALVTGASVAVSGLVGFVGLVVPHLVRMMLGTGDHRLAFPMCALGGALFLLAADTLARTIIQPAELRVGIVTAFVGSPFFLLQLARRRRL